MTTPRDVIAQCFADNERGTLAHEWHDNADRVLAALLSATASVRQELAALLNPDQWHPLPPERQWVRTRREGEEGENVCALWSEWTDREGRTTTTHHSFALPTHWALPAPPKEDKA